MSQLTLNSQLKALKNLSRPAGIELATLTRYDIPALAALYVVAYDSPETAEVLYEAVDEMRMSFNGEFGKPLDNSYVGAWHEGDLVGAILVTIGTPWDDSDKSPYIVDLMVHPDFRGRGIATALIGEAAKRVGAAGYRDIGLQIDLREAKDAARLYDYLGFEEINV
ncbi:MAG: GNAT family N-acetyltransferase [Actinomycetaceae bacterium]|nr:GNAT family N-acetyltransferase [Actinomycetaceae bacterium]